MQVSLGQTTWTYFVWQPKVYILSCEAKTDSMVFTFMGNLELMVGFHACV